jgi:hypothetical protein
MPKLVKTAREIAALIMEAASKLPECEGLTGVTIQPIDDDRVDYNWDVSHLQNNTSHLCQVAIGTIVDGAQRVTDLDTRTEMTGDQLSQIISTKSGFRADMIDVFKDGDGWSASLKAGPGWTPQNNANIKQIARAMAPLFRVP